MHSRTSSESSSSLPEKIRGSTGTNNRHNRTRTDKNSVKVHVQSSLHGSRSSKITFSEWIAYLTTFVLESGNPARCASAKSSRAELPSYWSLCNVPDRSWSLASAGYGAMTVVKHKTVFAQESRQ